ncbi:MAG: NAD(P)H-dependent oxidoreductase subunit E [Peptococcaceae bacterium]|nr:NAD(P)H-dependent oxidoreductase subunit E [Peptococcaceae bacterium]
MNNQFQELSMEKKRSIMRCYEFRRENLLDILLDLQEVCPGRCIDTGTAGWVARELGVTETKVSEALTFYTMLHTEPQARFVFEICSSTPCFFTKAQGVADVLSRELEVKEEEITKDGLFAFRFVPCFGSCAEGPAIKLGDEVYGNMTEESLKELIERCRELEGTEP